MNQSTREVHRGGHRIELTRTEFAILDVLMRNAGRVVPRDTLIAAVWGGSSDIETVSSTGSPASHGPVLMRQRIRDSAT